MSIQLQIEEMPGHLAAARSRDDEAVTALWGVSGLGYHRNQWGGSGHCPRPTGETLYIQHRHFRRRSCPTGLRLARKDLTAGDGSPAVFLPRIDLQGASRSRGARTRPSPEFALVPLKIRPSVARL